MPELLAQNSFFTGDPTANTANVSFSAGDVILFGMDAALFGGIASAYDISHPDLVGADWHPVAITSASGAAQFTKTFWTKAPGPSTTPAPLTLACAAGIGGVAYAIIRIPAAETAGALVQAVNTLEQAGINGGASPLMLSHAYPTPTQADSVNVAVWGHDVSGGGDAMAERVAPPWDELAEVGVLLGGHGVSIQVQSYIGADDESECEHTAGGGSGAPFVRSILLEFEGPEPPEAPVVTFQGSSNVTVTETDDPIVAEPDDVIYVGVVELIASPGPPEGVGLPEFEEVDLTSGAAINTPTNTIRMVWYRTKCGISYNDVLTFLNAVSGYIVYVVSGLNVSGANGEFSVRQAVGVFAGNPGAQSIPYPLAVEAGNPLLVGFMGGAPADPDPQANDGWTDDFSAWDSGSSVYVSAQHRLDEDTEALVTFLAATNTVYGIALELRVGAVGGAGGGLLLI